MKKNWCKKSVALFLAISILLPSFFLLPIQKAAAQYDEIFGSTLGPLAGSVASGIVSCTDIGTKIKTFLGSFINVSITNEVPVGDETLKTKETCLDAIGYNIARAALRLVTQELLRWINNGFDKGPDGIGYPFYRESESYFTELWENEVDSFSASLVNLDESLYPWAKAAASNILLANQAKFEDYARYTLNEFVVGGADGYRAGFAAGGWGAWEAMLLPQNNPIGFRFLTEQELDRRTGSGTQFSVDPKDRPKSLASRINEATNGFFSDQRCEYPITILPSDYLMGPPPPQETPYTLRGRTEREMMVEKGLPRSACKVWKTVTPGQAVAGALDISLGTKTSQLELADELNESMAAIFDALVSQAVTTGVSSLTEPCGALDPNYPNSTYENPSDDPACQGQ